jgi:hypothetical protein
LQQIKARFTFSVVKFWTLQYLESSILELPKYIIFDFVVQTSCLLLPSIEAILFMTIDQELALKTNTQQTCLFEEI